MTKSKRFIVIGAGGIAGLLLVITAAALSITKETETVYRESTVQYGRLTVGMTEKGAVTVGTSTQVLDLDISEPVTQNTGFSWQMAIPEGMGVQSRQSGSSQSKSNDRALTIDSIYVSEGQQIAAGDVLFSLTEESVNAIREELAGDVTQAELALKQLKTEQKSTALSAQHDYNTNITYGEAAQLEYDETIQEADTQYQEALTALEEALEKESELHEEISALTTQYQEEEHLYEEAAYLVIYIDKDEDPYGYMKALELRAAARSTMEAAADSLEETQDALSAQEMEVKTLTRQLSEAKKAQRTAQLEAQSVYDTRMIRYANASELYTVETALIEEKRQSV